MPAPLSPRNWYSIWKGAQIDHSMRLFLMVSSRSCVLSLWERRSVRLLKGVTSWQQQACRLALERNPRLPPRQRTSETERGKRMAFPEGSCAFLGGSRRQYAAGPAHEHDMAGALADDHRHQLSGRDVNARHEGLQLEIELKPLVKLLAGFKGESSTPRDVLCSLCPECLVWKKVRALPDSSSRQSRGGAGDYRLAAVMVSLRTALACGPLAPGTTSNSTRSPSFKAR